MNISGKHYRTIWVTANRSVRVINQSRLPFEFATVDLTSLDDAARTLQATRPTAHNLAWALTRMRAALARVAPRERAAVFHQPERSGL